MADGGIRDQLGGGFHRYATDAIWLVPHFEQMLYDNGQLARVYLHAWALTGDARYRAVATGTLDYMLRELTTDDGAFAASQDADTEGVEGATFTWRADEVRAALGDDAGLFSTAYGVTDGGNWEGVDHPVPRPSAAELAKLYAIPAAEVEERLDGRAQTLLALRAVGPSRLATTRRSRPGTGSPSGRSPTRRGCSRMSPTARRTPRATGPRRSARRTRSCAACSATDGRLGRSWKDGRATGQGVLEDYAHLADGLLALYEATFDERWFIDGPRARRRDPRALRRPGGRLLRHGDRPRAPRHAPEGHAGQRHAVRRRDGDAGPAPAAALTGEGRYRDAAERALAAVTPFATRYPTAFAMWLQATDFALAPVAEVAIVGDLEDAATRALLQVARGGYAPNRVVARIGLGAAPTAIPLLEDRARLSGHPTAYVCRGFACRLPVTDADALREQLAEAAAAV